MYVVAILFASYFYSVWAYEGPTKARTNLNFQKTILVYFYLKACCRRSAICYNLRTTTTRRRTQQTTRTKTTRSMHQIFSSFN